MQIRHSKLLGAYLAMLRKAHNYPQEQVAHYIGVSRQSIGHYEKGIRTPSVTMLKKLSHLYQVPFENMLDLMEDADNAYLLAQYPESALVYERCQMNYLKPAEEQLIRDYRSLPLKKQMQAKQYIEQLKS